MKNTKTNLHLYEDIHKSKSRKEFIKRVKAQRVTARKGSKLRKLEDEVVKKQKFQAGAYIPVAIAGSLIPLPGATVAGVAASDAITGYRARRYMDLVDSHRRKYGKGQSFRNYVRNDQLRDPKVDQIESYLVKRINEAKRKRWEFVKAAELGRPTIGRKKNEENLGRLLQELKHYKADTAGSPERIKENKKRIYTNIRPSKERARRIDRINLYLRNNS